MPLEDLIADENYTKFEAHIVTLLLGQEVKNPPKPLKLSKHELESQTLNFKKQL